VSLLDTWLPRYEFAERHARRVRAAPEAVRRALHEVDVARLPLVRMLMTLRALPGLVVAPRATLARIRSRAGGQRRLGLMALDGFALLADEPHEIVLGLTGRFWKASGEILSCDAATFRDAPPAGAARVAMNFLLAPQPDGATRVSTETRVHVPDATARRRFAWYWRAIRLGSGAIRHAMLGAVKRAAERAERAPVEASRG
jgi:hypothetical protein